MYIPMYYYVILALENVSSKIDRTTLIIAYHVDWIIYYPDKWLVITKHKSVIM